MKEDTKEEQRLEELRKEARLLEIADKNNKDNKMTVQELREEITQKTEEINGYLESRDADKAEEALAEKKRKLQKLLAVREAEDDEEREDLGRQRKQKESRTTGAVSELRAAVKFAAWKKRH